MTRSPITALGRTRPRNLTNSGALSAGENDKWQKACCHGAEHDYSNGDNLLCGSHYAFSSLSFILLFRDLVDGSRFSLAALSFTPFFVLGAFTTLAESSICFGIRKSLRYKEIRSDYEGDTSSDKAVSLIDGYLNYTNYQAYASEKSKNYIVQTLLEGVKNKVCNLFPNKHIQMYEDINEMLDGV